MPLSVITAAGHLGALLGGAVHVDGIWRSTQRVVLKEIAAGDMPSLLLLETSSWEMKGGKTTDTSSIRDSNTPGSPQKETISSAWLRISSDKERNSSNNSSNDASSSSVSTSLTSSVSPLWAFLLPCRQHGGTPPPGAPQQQETRYSKEEKL